MENFKSYEEIPVEKRDELIQFINDNNSISLADNETSALIHKDGKWYEINTIHSSYTPTDKEIEDKANGIIPEHIHIECLDGDNWLIEHHYYINRYASIDMLGDEMLIELANDLLNEEE